MLITGNDHFSHSQMAQLLLQQPGAGSSSGVTWWKVVYVLWPKLLGVQHVAVSLTEREALRGTGSIYPLINIMLYCLILGAVLFKQFSKEDIV